MLQKVSMDKICDEHKQTNPNVMIKKSRLLKVH